ncbi:MAG: TGS domain-containing protein [Candidatus Glassbacteria bacterium]|nr:TGS domain-containing protein [Candidatus Glassbacteria bacterium]
MPANLTPQYLTAEQAYKEAETVEDRIRCLEEMLRIIPRHKGTDHLQGDLRRRLSKLREQEKKAAAAGARKGHSYKVGKEGAGQVALAGTPNSGKSRLVQALTNAHPEVAAYPFTTRVPQAAMMPCKDASVQLVDMPPVSAEHEEHWVVDLFKAADMVLVVLDVTTDPLDQLEYVTSHFEERKLLRGRQSEIADEDRVPGAVYRPVLLACNKVDTPRDDELFELFRQMAETDITALPVSADSGRGLDELRQVIWDTLRVIRVYSKTPGSKAELREPYVLAAGSTVTDFAETVHRELAEQYKYARIWSENKYDGQMVNRDEPLADGDILELHT